jgi:hypothetical protein
MFLRPHQPRIRLLNPPSLHSEKLLPLTCLLCLLELTLQDHALPKSVVVRLAKSGLPENTMIQKEAVTALVKSATVFINFIAATYSFA